MCVHISKRVHVSVYAAIGKSKDVLGWQSKRSLEESLQDAWAWQKALL